MYIIYIHVHIHHAGPGSRPDDDLIFAQGIVSKVNDIRDSVFFFGMNLCIYMYIPMYARMYVYLCIHVYAY